MSGYNEPKFIEESIYESECAICANVIEKGRPLWYFNKRAYCMDHPKAEIRTDSAGVSPSPPAEPSTVTIRFDVPELTMLKDLILDLSRIYQAIDLQTEVLKGMRKDNNERR